MKTKSLLPILITALLVSISTTLVAQGVWEVISDFEGEGLVKGGVATLPALEDKSGNMWFVTNSGNIYKYEDEKLIKTIDVGCATLKDRKFNTEDCFKFFKDSQENLWLTTKNNGISRFDGSKWQNISEVEGLEAKKILCSFEDSKGNLWFGTKNNGVVMYNGQAWNTFSIDDGLSENEVTQIIEDKNGNMWFNTASENLSVFTGDSWQTTSLENIGLSSGDYRELFCASNGNVWVASPESVGYYDGTDWKTFGNTLDDVEMKAFDRKISFVFYIFDKEVIIIEDANTNIWIAYENGISKFDGDNWKSYTKKDGLPSDWQLYMLESDQDGNLYAGPVKNEGAIYKFDGTKWGELELKGEKFLVTIYVAANGNIWASGSKGLFLIANGKTKGEKLQKPEFGYMFNSTFQDSNGIFWFGLQGFKSRIMKYIPTDGEVF